MAADDIGAIYNTKIPGLEDAADIQEALTLYHYGSLSYNTSNTDTSQLPNPSLARHISNIQGQINTLDQKRTAGDFLPAEPSGIPDGFLWVDSNSTGPANIVYSTAIYSNTAPTENLVDGIVWIDKSEATKVFYVWDAGVNDWVRVNEFNSVVTTKGDLLATDINGDLQRLAVGQDGLVLTADSSATNGLAWSQSAAVDQEILSIMGVY